MSRRRQLLFLAAVTLLLHLPFLKQPVQGDEPVYLDMAAQALKHPLAPLDFRYVYLGHEVDMAGHPHPPLNAYILALLWILRGRFSVVFFHAAYLLFPLIISFASYRLATHFTSRPLWAALLVACSPLVQVNTNTLAGPEAPALAFLLAGAALFLEQSYFLSAIALSLAGFTALQTLAIAPILLLRQVHAAFAGAAENDLSAPRPPTPGPRPPAKAARTLTLWPYAAAAAPFLLWAGWQALQFGLTHRLPMAVLLGYVTGPSYGRLSLKLANGVALLQHLGVLVGFLPLLPACRFLTSRQRALAGGFCLACGATAAAWVSGYPWWERALLLISVSLGVAAVIWLASARHEEPFLSAWCLAYFGFALLVFFAGSARYLLPLAAPAICLFVRQCESRPRWLGAALAVNIFVGLNFSFAAYEFARIYPEVPPPPQASKKPALSMSKGSSFLVNGEWGFRYYLTRRGGRVLEQASVAEPGEWIVSSALSLGENYNSPAEAIAVPLEVRDLQVRTPLRLLDRFAHSGYSSVAFGLLPFSFSLRPLDRITYARTSPFLYLDAPWTPTQFSGRLVYLVPAGASIELPFEPEAARLRFAIFAQGQGQATFAVRDPSGQALFQQTVQAAGEVWQSRTLPIPGLRRVTLIVEAPATVRVGWGELVEF